MRYLSLTTIACMTRQEVTRLVDGLPKEGEVTLLRAAADMTEGRLVLEWEAPSRSVLEQLLKTLRIHFEWILHLHIATVPDGSGPMVDL